VWRRAPRTRGEDAIVWGPVTEMPVTVKLQCQNCGFTFVVTSSAAIADATPLACGQCRSTRWSSNSS
jgi:ribosomal protein S27AE